MNIKTHQILSLLLILLPITAIAEQYICIPDKASGFIFKNGSWEATTFNVSDTKYLISDADEEYPLYKGELYQVKEIGNLATTAACFDDFNDFGQIYCTALLTEFRFSKDNLRFIHIYHGTYHSGPRRDDGGDTPFMEIGKCSAF